MTVRSMATPPAVEEGVRLVLGVARLGEADLAGWWNCHGLDAVGRYVLHRTFRRTWRSAALELDVLSAVRRHNDALASRRSALHLFSDELPFRRWATAWLAEQKTSEDRDEIFGELESWTLDRAQVTIADWAGEMPASEELGDGLLLGELSVEEMVDEASLLSTARLLAASYVRVGSMFRAPYFDLRR
jgi:hypothetical protein